EMRFVPVSYFCTCWNVTSRIPPSSVCEIPRWSRRARTRLATSRSRGSRLRLGMVQPFKIRRCIISQVWLPIAYRRTPFRSGVTFRGEPAAGEPPVHALIEASHFRAIRGIPFLLGRRKENAYKGKDL